MIVSLNIFLTPLDSSPPPHPSPQTQCNVTSAFLQCFYTFTDILKMRKLKAKLKLWYKRKLFVLSKKLRETRHNKRKLKMWKQNIEAEKWKSLNVPNTHQSIQTRLWKNVQTIYKNWIHKKNFSRCVRTWMVAAPDIWQRINIRSL